MIDFWVKMVQKYIGNGMDFETAIAKVPAKWRDAVREAMENVEN